MERHQHRRFHRGICWLSDRSPSSSVISDPLRLRLSVPGDHRNNIHGRTGCRLVPFQPVLSISATAYVRGCSKRDCSRLSTSPIGAALAEKHSGYSGCGTNDDLSSYIYSCGPHWAGVCSCDQAEIREHSNRGIGIVWRRSDWLSVGGSPFGNDFDSSSRILCNEHNCRTIELDIRCNGVHTSMGTCCSNCVRGNYGKENNDEARIPSAVRYMYRRNCSWIWRRGLDLGNSKNSRQTSI